MRASDITERQHAVATFVATVRGHEWVAPIKPVALLNIINLV